MYFPAWVIQYSSFAFLMILLKEFPEFRVYKVLGRWTADYFLFILSHLTPVSSPTIISSPSRLVHSAPFFVSYCSQLSSFHLRQSPKCIHILFSCFPPDFHSSFTCCFRKIAKKKKFFFKEKRKIAIHHFAFSLLFSRGKINQETWSWRTQSKAWYTLVLRKGKL